VQAGQEKADAIITGVVPAAVLTDTDGEEVADKDTDADTDNVFELLIDAATEAEELMEVLGEVVCDAAEDTELVADAEELVL